MKKIALFLTLCILLCCFASCANETQDVSSTDSTVSGDISTEEVKDNIQYETIVSTGKTYTYETKTPDGKYPDSYNSELTDGVFGESVDYSNETFSGIAPAGGLITIVMDLGEDSKRLYKFGVSFLASTEAGVGGLGTSSVTVSNDGEKWQRMGYFKAPAFEEGTVQQAWVESESVVEARYVRFQLRAASAWLMLDELFVIADVAGNQAMAIYFEKLAASYTSSTLSDSDINLPDGEPVDRTLNKYSASIGRKYSVSRSPSAKYPGTDGILTDGIGVGASYNADNWVGWDGGDELVIDLPIGVTNHNVSELELSMLCQPALGIMLPYYVDFYISTDNSTFVQVGRVFAPNDPTVTNFTYALRFDKCVSAKYVRFVCAATECKYYFAEEMNVFYYAAENVSKPLYDKVVFDEVSDKVYKSSGSTSTKNLAKGLPYQISSVEALLSINESQHNTPASTGNLTDGKVTSSTNYTDPAWLKTRSGVGRNIFFDLGYQASISGFEINFLKNIPVGISLPGTVSLYLSDDGISWYNACQVYVPQLETDLGISVAKGQLQTPVEARFARVSFTVAPHTYVSEIEILGSEKISSKTIALDELNVFPEVTGKFTAPSDQLLGGAKDIVLAYLSKLNKMDKDFFKPYVAYLDKDGNIKDTLFDGFLFLPQGSGYLPNGVAHDDPQKPNNAADWKFLVEQMFVKDENFDALDQATAEVKQALGLNDYKVKVYPTICYISTSVSNFGDIDGDGVDEDLSSIEGVEKVVAWYMDQVITKFDQAGYQNIELAGFYWFHEAINQESSDFEVINLCSDQAEARGFQLFWIPYFHASGFSQWSNYGFSVACMQPNYAFDAAVDVNRIDTAISSILQYGMGVEIEISSQSLSDKHFFKKYMNYLSYGIKYGYMTDSIHMYYAGLTDYYDACYHKTAMGRAIYDKTYEFIKGTLGESLPVSSAISLSTAQDTPATTQLFEKTNEFVSGRIAVSPKHGTATINPDGTFTYYPNKGFSGTDTFEYILNDCVADSLPSTVTITVG